MAESSSPPCGFPLYSTVLIRPEAGSDGDSVPLFLCSAGQHGPGFQRALTLAETNYRAGGNLETSGYQIMGMDWDIFDASAESSKPIDKSSWHKQPLPLECRPAGLLLCGTLRVEPDHCTRLDPIPLTTGLPYGSIADDILLRGGLSFKGRQEAPWLSAGFSMRLQVRPGYRPVAPVGIRVTMYVDETKKTQCHP